MQLQIRSKRDSLLQSIYHLAQDKFAPRAAGYDEAAQFPYEDFQDLVQANLHAPAVPTQYGGKGLGPSNNLWLLWQMTKTLAEVDLSLARCWEGHINCQMLLSGMASPQQQERWFQGIVQDGDIWAAWSGEPQSKLPGQTHSFGTEVKTVPGGYVLNGTKVFATSAPAAKWALLLVNSEGVGGARHASDRADSVLLLACQLSDPSVSFDPKWWQPIGMRATVSYLVTFDNTFIPAENLVGAPGQYMREEWQTRFTPHYGSSFWGAAAGAYRYALQSMTSKQKRSDPYIQQRFAKATMNLQTMELWLHHVADLWEGNHIDDAKRTGNQVRYLTEQLAIETVQECIHICGARSYIKPSPLERIYRDLSFYVKHDNSDRVLASIGRELLSEDCDRSFFNAHSSSN